MRLTSRMAVVLPQPDGPTRTQISPGGDLEGEVVDRRLARAGVALLDVVEDQRRGLRVGRLPLVVGGVLGDQGEAPAQQAGGSGGTLPLRSRPPAAHRRARRPPGGRRAPPAAASRPSAVATSQSANHAFFGQQRAVEVRADDVVAAHALEARRAGVAVALQDAAERLRARSEVRAPAVVLEAGEDARLGRARGAATSMATLPISRGPSSRTVRRSTRPDARAAPRRRARSCGRGAGSRRRRRGRPRRGRPRRAAPRAWSSTRSARAERLVAVLTAAEVEEVVRVGVDRGRRASPPSASKPSPRQAQRRSSSRRFPRSA